MQTLSTKNYWMNTDRSKTSFMQRSGNIIKKIVATSAVSAALLVPAASQAQPMPNGTRQPVQVVTAPQQPRNPGWELLVPAALILVVVGSILHDHDL
jgi:hypothetical protein